VKILLIFENELYANNGIERHCRNIMDLYRNDPQVEFTYLCKEQVAWHWNKWMNKIIFDYRQLKQRIAQSDCDIVHVHGFAQVMAAQSLRAALSLKKYVVYTAHYHPFSSLRHPLLGQLYAYFYIHPHLPRVNAIVAINNDDRRFFERFNSNVINIPNWITGIEHSSVERKRNMILFVGRNHDNKGLHYLNHIPVDRYEVHCVTNSAAGLSGNIKVHLSISDAELSKLYSEASLLVVPSRYEAFSYATLEALERGTPVLMSNNVRIADHLMGISGWDIFEFGNTGDFLKKIDSTMAKHVDVGKIMQRFSANNIKKKFDSLYKLT
jgi:glycosyltransferase involved in cell wall biosynthesis